VSLVRALTPPTSRPGRLASVLGVALVCATLAGAFLAVASTPARRADRARSAPPANVLTSQRAQVQPSAAPSASPQATTPVPRSADRDQPRRIAKRIRPRQAFKPARIARKRSPRSSQGSAPTQTESALVAETAPVVHAPAPATGFLRINSRPWSRVYVDGRMVGATPQTRLELDAGPHVITLVSPEFGLKRTLNLHIRGGETVTRSVEMSR
jgi:hypothetical protein